MKQHDASARPLRATITLRELVPRPAPSVLCSCLLCRSLELSIPAGSRPWVSRAKRTITLAVRYLRDRARALEEVVERTARPEAAAAATTPEGPAEPYGDRRPHAVPVDHVHPAVAIHRSPPADRGVVAAREAKCPQERPTASFSRAGAALAQPLPHRGP